VKTLASTAERGRRALKPIEPVAAHFAELTKSTTPFAKYLSDTLVDLRRRGGYEGVYRTAYSLATSTALYDDTSHYFSLFAGVAPQCFVPQYLIPVAGCDHSYDGPGKGQIPINDPTFQPSQAKALVKALGPGSEKNPALNTPLLAPLRKMIFPKGKSAGGLDIKRAEHVLDFLLK
jgi:hypothetical protein